MKRIFAAVLLAAVLCLHASAVQAPSVSASSAILYDSTAGKVIWEHRSEESALIASTTKIMTAFLVVQLCPMETMVTVPREAVGTEGSSAYLRAGERLSVRDLLLGLMLSSGNDAAIALAKYTCGSVEDFVRLMNWEAAKLGLENTRFANPNGLDDENNYSTALDLAKLTAAALQNERFAEIVVTKQAQIGGGRRLKNHNKLLWQYDGCIGVKTGFTKAAGRILVSAAKRDGRTLIAVTINDGNDWADHKALYDYGFAQ
ncbi:MAG: D-alanyl-D-alanine carboxypeptidase [Clostridia bacterium]|nr:D-alanyl-D-alanine carboxypeptidase [Clostridia bacterium]